MIDHETNCEALRVLGERIVRERELREALEKRLDERDRRYEDRFEAQERAVYAALAAQDKLTQAAFASSEKAIVKAEAAQISYNATHNDLTRKMDAQYKDTLPRAEAETKFKATEDKIADLRESRSEHSGRTGITSLLWAMGASVLTAIMVWLITKGIK